MTEREKSQTIRDVLTIREHHLPHWQLGGSTYFVTFRSARGNLSTQAPTILQEHLHQGDGHRYDIAIGVLMPDHVHLLIRPREASPGVWHDLSEIMQSIKGASARRINQALGTKGTLWQKESHDRIVRDEAEFEEKTEYIYWNPRRAGIVEDPDDYPFFVFSRECRR